MSYAAEIAQFDENVKDNLTDDIRPSTGYGENFIMGVGQTVDRALSISESIVRGMGGWSLNERNDELRALRKTGAISEQEWVSFIDSDTRGASLPNYSAMAKWMTNKGTPVRTDAQINGEMRETLNLRTEQAQDVFERQSGGGLVGEVIGSLLGYSLEPAGIVAIPLEVLMIGRAAYTLSQAATRLGRATQVARIAATANMATEAAIQPIVFDWHEQMGVDMTWSDAIFNIASVGVLSGLGSGVASALKTKKTFKGEQLGTFMDESLKRREKPITVNEMSFLLRNIRNASGEAMDDEAKNLLAQTEKELNSSDPNLSAQEHFEKLDDIEKAFDESTPWFYDEATKKPEAKKPSAKLDNSILDADFDAYVAQKTGAKTADEIAGDEINAEFSEFESFVTEGFPTGDKELVGVEQIMLADERAKQLKTCLTGGQ